MFYQKQNSYFFCELLKFKKLDFVMNCKGSVHLLYNEKTSFGHPSPHFFSAARYIISEFYKTKWKFKTIESGYYDQDHVTTLP